MSLVKQRQAEEKERRRESIVDAAERVFSAAGFDAATIDEVAAGARVSRALVYTYFRNKTELHLAICLRALRMLHARFLEVAAAHPRGYDRVAAVVRAYADLMRERPDYFEALYRFETKAPAEVEPGSLEPAVFEAGRAVHEVTIGGLMAGVHDGSIRGDLGDPMLAAFSLWGCIHGIVQLAERERHFFAQAGTSSASFTTYAIDYCLRGLRPPHGAAHAEVPA